MSISLETFNGLPEHEAEALVFQCCSAEAWVEKMVEARPFLSVEACQQHAALVWNSLTEADYLQAFAGHPKIGDLNSLNTKYASTKALAAGEQSGVAQAQTETLTALVDANVAYEAKNGFIFIVCATGKSADEMLSLLQERLANSREKEIKISAVEQQKITKIRIDKLFSES